MTEKNSKKIKLEKTDNSLRLNLDFTPKSSKNEINSIEEFIQKLSEFITPSLDNADDHVFFYRGQANESWKLTPSIFRDGISAKEKQITLEIISRQAGKFSEDQTMFDFLIRAQHFGAPTRLLDVTGNPLIALYFACCDLDQINHSGKVFLFKIEREKLKYFNSDRVALLTNLSTLSEKEKNHLRDGKLTAEKKATLKNLKQNIKNEKHGFYLEMTDDLLTSPLLVLPQQNNERIIAQQGAFLLHSLNEKDALNREIITVKEFMISNQAKGNILRSLEVLGVHKSSVYPGIKDCAEYLKDSFQRLKSDAEKGITSAEYKLGEKYRIGFPPYKKDIKQAIIYLERAAKKGHIEAQFNLGVIYFKEKDFDKAEEYFQKAANQGNAEAQFNLGVMYSIGDGGEKDLAKAREYFQMAADQGDVDAQCNLGVMYFKGEGGGQDFSKAREYFQMAADQGNEQAQCNLGVMYSNGDDGEQDFIKAREYFQKAADQGNEQAQCNLGVMYSNGDDGEQDFIKAREYFQKAADQGDADAQCNLGVMYAKGDGSEQDFSKARSYFQKAALQGDAEAQFGLGLMYYNGDGGEKDFTKAREYFQMAAEQGLKEAIEALKELDELEAQDKADKPSQKEKKKPKTNPEKDEEDNHP